MNIKFSDNSKYNQFIFSIKKNKNMILELECLINTDFYHDFPEVQTFLIITALLLNAFLQTCKLNYI